MYSITSTRSDLALELTSGYTTSRLDEYIQVTEIVIDNKTSKKIGKPIGEYTTIESSIVSEGITGAYDRLSKAIANSLKKHIGGVASILVVGLGNPLLTADALGSKVLESLVVTRALIDQSQAIQLSAFCPSVAGVTGIESFDIISGIVQKIRPELVIAVDSLASAAVSRLASAFQICSSGITPGSGVSNHKKRLDKSSLGTNVISIGVPLVVYADIIIREALAESPQNSLQRQQTMDSLSDKLSSLIVTPKEIDVLVKDCGKVLADAINMALGLSL